MNADLLTRLAQAHTEEERTWLVTENLLHTLSPELQSAIWASVIPHWFDAEILAALRPELTETAEEVYGQLQQLPFVEVFPGRGHNIHERTRRAMLEQLWQVNSEEFKQLSGNAAQYFSSDSPENQIEAIYHQVVADPDKGDEHFWDLAQTWYNNFRLVELEAILDNLQEHMQQQRLGPLLIAGALYWRGRARFRGYRNDKALENYEQAIGLFRDVGSRLGEANTLKAIGDVLQFLDRRDEALENYEQAIGLFRDVGDRLGEANTLLGLGDLLSNREEALELYWAAQQLYGQIGNQYSQARNLRWFIAEAQVTLGQLSAAQSNLQDAAEMFNRIGLDNYRDETFRRIEALQAIRNQAADQSGD
ncbi:MAG: tetratricopeptide repeat protein [Leptolyngbya sp. LCM1.Bin17]|nr:MAG: tetratricopeptide repeat protein [Leptolyngbya sp. LCM1.Bin17]